MYWKLLDLTDATGHLSDLTNAGGAITFAAGPLAGEGHGTPTAPTDVLTHAADGAYLSGYGNSFTVRTMVKALTPPSLAMPAIIIGEGANDGFDMYINSHSISAEIPGSDGSYPSIFTDYGESGNWRHIIFRWDNTTKTLSTFVDGTQADQSSAVNGGASDPTNTLSIGFGESGDGHKFQQASVGIWKDIALTDDQCQALWNNGSPLTYADFLP